MARRTWRNTCLIVSFASFFSFSSPSQRFSRKRRDECVCTREQQDAPVMQCASRTAFFFFRHVCTSTPGIICNIAESGRVPCVSYVYKFSSSRNVTPVAPSTSRPLSIVLEASPHSFFFSFSPSGFCFVLLASSPVVVIRGSPGRACCRRCCCLSEFAPI